MESFSQGGCSTMWRKNLAYPALLVFALALSVRLPFALNTSVLDIKEAEYLDLARYFEKEGRGRSCLTRHLFWKGRLG